MAKVVKKPVKEKQTAKPAKNPFAGKLKAMSKHWKAAIEQAGDGAFENLPEGQYVARLVGAELCESANGRLQVKWDHKVVQGEEAGKHQCSFDGLDTPESLVWLVRKFSRLQIEIDPDAFDLAGLPNILQEIVDADLLVKIQVKEKGDFVNTYLNKLLDEADFDDLDEGDGKKPSSGKKDGKKAEDDPPRDEDEGEEVTFVMVMEMAAEELDEIIKGNSLEVDTSFKLLKKRMAVAEALGLEEDDDTTTDDGKSGDDDTKPTEGCKVLFLLKGKTKEGEVLKVTGDKLSVKVMPDGPTVEVAVDECEVDDTPF